MGFFDQTKKDSNDEVHEDFTEAEKPFSLYNDERADMTRGRRLARFLSRFGSYNPHIREEPLDDGSKEQMSNNGDIVPQDIGKNKGTKPSLDTAWEYFEHIVLPRYYVEGPFHKQKGEEKHRAEPGEHQRPTKLYPIFGTSDEDMSDFGIGVALYFSTIKYLCGLCLLAGLINIPNILYFTSDAYEGGDSKRGLVEFGMKGNI